MSMTRRPLGRTSLLVSPLGLGCSSLGGGLFRHDRAQAGSVLREALDAGVDFFDTADNYSMGESEKLIGEAVRGRRDRVVLATKGGAAYSTSGQLALRVRPLLRPFKSLLTRARRSINLARDQHKAYNFAPDYLRRALEGSLRRLGTDYIDLYQLYNGGPEQFAADEIWETLERCKDQGKIRHIGISTNTLDDAISALAHPSIEAVQVAVSLIDREPLQRLLPAAQAKGVGIIASAPLAQGLLTDATGPVKADESSHYTLEEIDLRRRNAQACRSWVKPDRTLAQAALKFLLQQAGVAVSIPCAVASRELSENMAALKAPAFSAAELQSLGA
jgi:aryl-alcohol dehydrogenase-like predicted oxidoreductase